MKIIGVTGGVGSGKSQVLAYLEKHFGAVVCQADHVAWDLQKPGAKGYLDIVKHFGTKVLNEDETINRKKLGEIVFGNPEELLVLNQIMHPAVKEEIKDIIRLEEEKGTRYFVLEAALLLEEAYNQICDEIWYIYSNETVRRQRLKESRMYTDEKIDAILASQMSECEFREQCHIVIDNNGEFSDTCEQINQIMGEKL